MTIEPVLISAEALRQKAETVLLSHPSKLDPSLFAPKLESMTALLHELQVHQIELEMQNEELRRAQLALEASRSQYFDLYDLAPVGYCRINQNGVVVEVNLTLATMLGSDKIAMIRKPLSRFILPQDQDQFYLLRKQLLETREPQKCEVQMLLKDGSSIWVELIAIHETHSSGETLFRVVVSDISLRKRAEQELITAQLASESANRAKSEFLANMSHEIRTPLTAMLGFIDVLSDDESIAQSPEKRGQTIETIRNSGKHLLTILNDILDLSKIESGKMTAEHIDTPLVNILHEIHSLLQPMAIGKGIDLCVSIPSPLPDRIRSDPTRLRQILLNLVGNAVKFTESGSISITANSRCQDGSEQLVIDIADTGPGIAPEQTHLLFNVFGQADGSMTRKHGGTGLGLNLSRRLANIMGGQVSLLKSEIGKGSCFRVVLPLDAMPGCGKISGWTDLQPLGETVPSPPSLTLRGRILLAEDGPDNQRLIAFILRKAGAEVETAVNGLVALNMMEQAETNAAPFDLLITDIQMPEMDGYTLARTLRDRGSTLPIIALTAHATTENRNLCLKAGCDDYETKPIDKVALITKCAALIAKSKPTA